MDDAPADASEPPPLAAPAPTGSRPRRTWSWQLGLRGLILLVAIAALGLTIVIDRRRIADLTDRIDQMRPMVWELEVNDPTQFAAIDVESPWSNDLCWDVYLPPGPNYRLNLTTRAVDQDDKFPAPLNSTLLPAGRHRLCLIEKQVSGNHVFTINDGSTLCLQAEEPPAWIANSDGWSACVLGNVTTQQPTNRPLQFVRRRYHWPILKPDGTPTGSTGPPNGPTEGMLLWIETVTDDAAKPPTKVGPDR